MKENESKTLRERVKSRVQNIDRKKKILAGFLGVAAIAVGVLVFMQRNSVISETSMPSFNMNRNDMAGDYVTASGTTSLGYTMDEFEPDYIETELYIDEVYLSSSDEVEAGTAVLKVSQESITEAREELKEKEVEANLAYRAGIVSYEQSKINAKYTYDAALLEGEQAEAVYQSALKSAEKKVQQARDKVTETETQIEEYKNAYTDYYYAYNVDKYKERFENNQSFYYTLLGEFGFSDSEVPGGSATNTGGNSSGNTEMENQNFPTATPLAQDANYLRRRQILQQMKANVQNSEKYYLNAWDEYEAAANQATSQVEKLEIQINSLRADLAEAETDYQLEVLEAETTYKKSLAQLELAKSNYDAAIQKAEDELENLEDEKEEAKENLTEFETLLGDGYLYTQNAGTVMMVGVRKDSNLQGEGMVVAYRNAQDISVTVSVAQEDINNLQVGDKAQIIVEDYGTFEGEIAYLNPVSNSESRTNITYEVLVKVKGDKVENLKENLTANVIFTIGDNGQ